jgi:hypothetical protein
MIEDHKNSQSARFSAIEQMAYDGCSEEEIECMLILSQL